MKFVFVVVFHNAMIDLLNNQYWTPEFDIFRNKLRFKLIPLSVEIADIIWFRKKYSKKVPKWSECESIRVVENEHVLSTDMAHGVTGYVKRKRKKEIH